MMCIYLQYWNRKYPGVRGNHVRISFKFVLQQDSTLTSRGDYIELKFDTPQARRATRGWIIKPHTVPCRVSTCIMYIINVCVCVSIDI